MKIPVIAIFDIGKTNKKLFLFDEDYKIVFERSARFIETKDEDGDACENLESLRLSVFDSLHEVLRNKQFDIKAINFSTYGASLVYVDELGKPLAPLYNYLKAYPQALQNEFYATYGGEEAVAVKTASPVLGSLNSGMQFYRIKHEKPELFEKIKYALHLPQYMSSIITGKMHSDITSIGCHTNFWDFEKNDYHAWVYQEGLAQKLAPIFPGDGVMQSTFPSENYLTGVGLHDSSAALIPYIESFKEPFILLSTGTWCISLNPFNSQSLTKAELDKDCLCYLSYQGKPIKASRVFSGFEHEQEVKRIVEHFGTNAGKYKTIKLSLPTIQRYLPDQNLAAYFDGLPDDYFNFANTDLQGFVDDEEAYHNLIFTLVFKQYKSTQLVLKNTSVKRIFVDGGFSKNQIFMNLLAMVFPEIEVYAASMAQATSMGAAVAIHKHWNTKPLPTDMIALKLFVSPVKN
ncbi:carbohydrate kinase [Pelobium manganitolerans]|uniref:Carbohydrate kinase n=1 Tax=Pelobium manganitolerans TaxID=1842495 RepID=A0A419S2P1_9SPHI|nr:FGGY family carbohydrate kinase [Pelobium manganitolerans]RKD13249.1 carbohydrate kinase [Pelobium manganitolerans]